MLPRNRSSRSLLLLAVAFLLTLLIGWGPKSESDSSDSSGSNSSQPALVTRVSTMTPLTPTPAPCAPKVGSWLHTQGIWIVDSHNCKVRLAGVTWYGMQTTNYVPAGLDFKPYMKILREIKSLGFNTIRVPISDQLVRDNNKIKVRGYLAKNPELVGLHPLDVLDRLVAGAQRLGLMVILDNHFSVARTPASFGKSSTHGAHRNEATWTAPGYTEKRWIRDWVTVTKRYISNPTVIGFDLRNEPHTNYKPGVSWNLKAYLTQGATWGPYPDKRWKPSSDWQAAATKAGNAILAINPNLLMFVDGVQLYPDQSQPGGVENYWWGSILRGVQVDPVHFKVPNHLVYSPHEWGPWKYNLGEFSYKTTYKGLTRVFRENWGFILHSQNPAIRAPIWLGEFNTCDATPTCADDKNHGSQGQWFQILMKFLHRNPEVNWSYYPLNGTNTFDQPSNNGILNKHWSAVKQPAIMEALAPNEHFPWQLQPAAGL